MSKYESDSGMTWEDKYGSREDDNDAKEEVIYTVYEKHFKKDHHDLVDYFEDMIEGEYTVGTRGIVYIVFKRKDTGETIEEYEWEGKVV